MLRTIWAALCGVAFATAVHAAQPAINKVTVLTDKGGRVDWSPKGDVIAYDRVNEKGYFEIWSMRPNGSSQQCLTCGKSGSPKRHKGNPAYHADGQWIVFQAERDDVGDSGQGGTASGGFRRGGRGMMLNPAARADFFGAPGRGFVNDLWIMDARGDRYWKVVTTDRRVGGILHPHFSRRGDKLTWAQRIGAGNAVMGVGSGGFGQWDIRVADFSVVNGEPKLSNIHSYQPGRKKQLFETHGFSADGSKVIYCATSERGSNKIAFDVYLFDLQNKELTNLTDSPDEWDEHGQISPDGTKVLWMSSKGMPLTARAAEVKTDFWIMNIDGSNKQRLTWFNDPKNPQYIKGGVTAGDSSWSPDGKHVVGYLIEDATRNLGKIVMMDVNEGRP
jgi:Tol biopolymer transport system component